MAAIGFSFPTIDAIRPGRGWVEEIRPGYEIAIPPDFFQLATSGITMLVEFDISVQNYRTVLARATVLNLMHISKNLLVYYCKCCNLIGYTTSRYLFINRYRVAVSTCATRPSFSGGNNAYFL